LIKRKPGFSGKVFWSLEIPFKTGFTVYIRRLASNKIFSPSNRILWEAGRAKDLSAPLYKQLCLLQVSTGEVHFSV
jgi:hypothetical protein